jgi:ubiquinone/menaquinone biosynthesis C-methylase UbiE
MKTKQFNVMKFEKLNNPKRFELLPPSAFKDATKLEHVGTIADLGAGTGFFAKEWTRIFPESKVYALDISEFMVSYMKETLVPIYPNLYPLLVSKKNIPLENETIDLFITINLHHELDNHIEVLKECFRLLRRGGNILISDWKKDPGEFGPPIELRIDAIEVEAQLLAAGFNNIKINNDFKNNYLISAVKE